MSQHNLTRWAGVALAYFLSSAASAELVVYTAKVIRTMEPALPIATAVAVENGEIVAVGSEESLQPLSHRSRRSHGSSVRGPHCVAGVY